MNLLQTIQEYEQEADEWYIKDRGYKKKLPDIKVGKNKIKNYILQNKAHHSEDGVFYFFWSYVTINILLERTNLSEEEIRGILMKLSNNKQIIWLHRDHNNCFIESKDHFIERLGEKHYKKEILQEKRIVKRRIK